MFANDIHIACSNSSDAAVVASVSTQQSHVLAHASAAGKLLQVKQAAR
jgi:hypothetical protein